MRDKEVLERIKGSPRLKRAELRRIDASIAELMALLAAARAVREWLTTGSGSLGRDHA